MYHSSHTLKFKWFSKEATNYWWFLFKPCLETKIQIFKSLMRAFSISYQRYVNHTNVIRTKIIKTNVIWTNVNWTNVIRTNIILEKFELDQCHSVKCHLDKYYLDKFQSDKYHSDISCARGTVLVLLLLSISAIDCP